MNFPKNIDEATRLWASHLISKREARELMGLPVAPTETLQAFFDDVKTLTVASTTDIEFYKALAALIDAVPQYE